MKTDEEKKQLNLLAVKKYQEKNKDKIKSIKIISSKEYRKNNKDKISKSKKTYVKNNIIKHRKYQNGYIKKRIISDPLFKLSRRVRTMINDGFKSNNTIKNEKTIEILGCSFIEFKKHLEANFISWMNWNNHGLYNGELNYGWDIDHIIPLSSATSKEELIKLCHYTNLQPLCSKVNRYIKKTKLL